jgi:hypothetical protein
MLPTWRPRAQRGSGPPTDSLRHVVFEGLRADKPAREVVRDGPGVVAVAPDDEAESARMRRR